MTQLLHVDSSGPQGANAHRAIFSVFLGVIFITLDISLTSTALPAITKALDIQAAQTIWIVNVYYVAVIAALLPLAAIGEIYGHRRVFLFGLLTFSLGSLSSGLSSSIEWLMGGRALLGVGSAAVAATTPALIKTLYPPEKIGRGLGLYATVVAISLTIGPTLASAVLTIANWNWLFLPNAAVGLIVVLLSLRGLPDSERNVRDFDGWAASLCSLMFACLLTGISGMARLGWPIVLSFMVAAVLFGTALLKREHGKSSPIFAMDLFRIRMFALSAVTSVCAFTVQGLVFVVLPFFFIERLGYSQIEAGFLISPWAATLVFMGVIAGSLTERIAPGVLGFVGLLLVSAGLALLILLPYPASVVDIVWRLIVCGVGYGLFQSPNMVAMMNSAPRNRSGSAGGILASARLLGQAVGATIVAFSFVAFQENGIVFSFWMAVCVALAGAIASVLRMTTYAKR